MKKMNHGFKRTGSRSSFFWTVACVLFSFTVISGQTPGPETANQDEGVRIKDIARITGVRGNQLLGYGVVVGLPGTGDSRTAMAKESLENLLGGVVPGMSSGAKHARNIAAVVVTAELPPFAAQGDRIDLTVSSVGDARSIEGGVLLQTPLYGGDRKTYAVGQGTIATATAGKGNEIRVGPNVGRVIGGAYVERAVEGPDRSSRTIHLTLKRFDFSTLARMQKAIRESFPDLKMESRGGSLSLEMSQDADLAQTISTIENLRVVPGAVSRVVINERTGTIVMGGDIRIDPVAVSRGGMDMKIGTKESLARMGILVDLPSENDQENGKPSDVMRSMQAGNVEEVVSALNSLGAGIRDIIAILEALRDSGAMHAEVIVI